MIKVKNQIALRKTMGTGGGYDKPDLRILLTQEVRDALGRTITIGRGGGASSFIETFLELILWMFYEVEDEKMYDALDRLKEALGEDGYKELQKRAGLLLAAKEREEK